MRPAFFISVLSFQRATGGAEIDTEPVGELRRLTGEGAAFERNLPRIGIQMKPKDLCRPPP